MAGVASTVNSPLVDEHARKVVRGWSSLATDATVVAFFKVFAESFMTSPQVRWVSGAHSSAARGEAGEAGAGGMGGGRDENARRAALGEKRAR